MPDSLLVRHLRLNLRWGGSLKNRGEIIESSKLYTLKSSQLRYIDSPLTELVVAEVTSGLKLPGTGRANRRLAILSLLNACFEAVYNEPEETAEVGILWPTSNSEDPKSRYKRKLFSTPAKKGAVDNLETHGYIKFYKGGKDGESFVPGKVSLVMPTMKLYALYEEVTAQPFKVDVSVEDDRELVELKDSEKRFVNYVDTEFTNSTRQLLQSINAINFSHDWRFEHRSKGLTDIPDASLRLSRRFLGGSFEKYGRFHCEAQGLKRYKRRSITIDGEDTVELDFEAMLATIAYAWGGLDSAELEAWECEGDPYELGGVDRKLAKHAFMVCMNAESRRAATKALITSEHLITQDGHYDSKIVSFLIDALIKKHWRIKHLFFSSTGNELTYKESTVMAWVLQHCVNFKLPVLAIHDGIVCKKGDALMMTSFMREGFKNNFHVTPVIKLIEDNSGRKELAPEYGIGSYLEYLRAST